MQVKFYEKVDDEKLRFAVIVARHVLPDSLTYPEIQPILFDEACRRGVFA